MERVAALSSKHAKMSQMHPIIYCMKYMLKYFGFPTGNFSPDLLGNFQQIDFEIEIKITYEYLQQAFEFPI